MSMSYADTTRPLPAVTPRRARVVARAAGWALAVLDPPVQALAALAGKGGPTGRHAHRPDPRPCPPAPVTPPNTFSHAPDIDPVEIDPRRAIAELTQSAAPARNALDAFHATWRDLPREQLQWTVLDDGAVGRLTSLNGPDTELHGIVAAYAAALAVQVDEQTRGDGHTIVTAAGDYWGVRIAVEATCTKPLNDDLLVFQVPAGDMIPLPPAGGGDAA